MARFRSMFLVSALVAVTITLAACSQSTAEIRLGLIGPTSGPSAYLGEGMTQAASLAVDEINAQGGILGKKVRLIVRDEQGKPDVTLSVGKELAEKEKVHGVIGPSFSADSVAVGPYFAGVKVPHIHGSGSNTLSDTEKFPYSFRTYFSADMVGEPIAAYAVDKLGHRKVGILHETAEFGKSAVPPTLAALKKRGVEPVAVESFPLNAPDVTTHLTKLRDAGIDVLIVLNNNAVDGGRIAKTLLTLKMDIAVVGSLGLGQDEGVKLAGQQAYKNVYSLMFRNLTFDASGKVDPAIQTLIDKLKQRGGGKLKYSLGYMVQFYDAVYLFKAAMEKAGTTDGSKVKEQLEALKSMKMTGGTYTSSKTSHDLLENGVLVMAYPATINDDGLQKLAN